LIWHNIIGWVGQPVCLRLRHGKSGCFLWIICLCE